MSTSAIAGGGHTQLRLQSTVGHCTVQLVRYDSAAFDPAAFADAAIAMPDSIRRSVSKRQAEFFFGRLAAALALEAHGYAAVEVGIGALRAPVFPAALIGTITHTGSVAAAAVLPAWRCRGLGIDIEAAIAPDAMDSVAQLVLRPAEQAVLAAAGALAYPLALALVFSAKESFYKGLSRTAGRVFDFTALRLLSIDLGAQRLHFVTEEALGQEWPVGRRCEVGFHYLAGGEVLTIFSW